MYNAPAQLLTLGRKNGSGPGCQMENGCIMSIPTYSHAEMESDTYRWTGGRISVSIFSQIFPLGPGATDRKLRKITQEDHKRGNVDVDAAILDKLFNEMKFPADVNVDCNASFSFDKMTDYLKKLGSKEDYDCFFFIFLTYIQPENTNVFTDERLHFNDTILEKGLVPLEKILDEVKDLKVTQGKPKIFLIQADDVSLLDENQQYIKGPTADITTKIPHDSDRLIIKSTIPQRMANSAQKNDVTPNPSFLIQAFCEALRDKACNREDLLCLTTVINGKVADMLTKSNHSRAKDMPVPLVDSTLRKIVNLAV